MAKYEQREELNPKPRVYFWWQWGGSILIGLFIGGVCVSSTVTSSRHMVSAFGTVGVLALVGVGSFGLLALAVSVWPLVYGAGARVVITPESVTKIYPLQLRTRSFLRSELGRIESEEVSANARNWSVRVRPYKVFSFRRRDGSVAFKLGTNFWGRDELERLVVKLLPDALPESVALPGPAPETVSVWIVRVLWLLLVGVSIAVVVTIGFAFLVLAVLPAIALILLMAETDVSFAELLHFNLRVKDN